MNRIEEYADCRRVGNSGLAVIAEDQKAPAIWDELITRLNGHLSHSSLRVQLQNYIDGAAPVYLSVLNGGYQTVAAALAFWKKSPHWAMTMLTKSLVMNSLPLVQDGRVSQMRDVLLQIEEYARRNGAVSLQFGSLQNNRACSEFGSLGYEIQTRYEFRLDLSASEEKLWSNLKSSHRRKIRKAMSESLEIVEGDNLADLTILRQLQLSAKERAQKRGEDFVVHGEDYYQAIKSVLMDSGAAVLHIARYQEQPVSAVLITVFNERAFYMYGGTNELGYSLSAAYYLLWEAILRAKQMGCVEFNLGGVPGDARSEDSPSHGLYRFKRGFGAVEVECTGGMKVLSPWRYRTYRGLKRITKPRGVVQ